MRSYTLYFKQLKCYKVITMLYTGHLHFSTSTLEDIFGNVLCMCVCACVCACVCVCVGVWVCRWRGWEHAFERRLQGPAASFGTNEPLGDYFKQQQDNVKPAPDCVCPPRYKIDILGLRDAPECSKWDCEMSGCTSPAPCFSHQLPLNK